MERRAYLFTFTEIDEICRALMLSIIRQEASDAEADRQHAKKLDELFTRICTAKFTAS